MRFVLPVAINFIGQFLFQTVIVVYDFGATQTAALYFAIPYWVGVIFIGLRRWRHPTVSDAVFLTFGQVASISILFLIRPYRLSS